MHFCANVVALDEGRAGAVLLRAGEVLSDPGVAHVRRPTARGRDAELARGPARLCTLLGIGREHNGVDVLDPASPVRLEPGERVADAAVRTGPRVGVAAGAGAALAAVGRGIARRHALQGRDGRAPTGPTGRCPSSCPTHDTMDP